MSQDKMRPSLGKMAVVGLLALVLVGGVAGQEISAEEDGDISEWSVDSGSFSVGSFSTDGEYSIIGDDDFDTSGGLSRSFPAFSGSKLSFYHYSESGNSGSGGSSEVSWFNENGDLISSIYFRVSGDIEVYDGSDYIKIGSYAENQNWNFIEFRNIDYGSGTYDILVDESVTSSVSMVNPSSSFNEIIIEYDNRYGDSGGSDYWDSILLGPRNDPPKTNISVSPDPLQIGQNTSYVGEASDPDGNVTELNLTVFKDGSQVFHDSVQDKASYNWTDVYVPQSEGSLDARFTAEDDAGATTTEWLNRTLTDEAPQVSLQSPGNETYFEYGVPLEFSVSDSDSEPGEDWSCSVERDGSVIENYYLKEGTNSTVSDTVQSDLGGHNVSVACTDGSGNTGTASENYHVKAFEFSDSSSQASVFETETIYFDSDFKSGSMVESIDLDLSWNGSVVNSSTVQASDSVESLSESLYHAIPLSYQDGESVDWRFEASVNYQAFNGSSSSLMYDSSLNSQTVNWVVENPQISTVNNRFIEKQDVKASVLYQDNGFNGDISCEISVNGSSRIDGCTQSFDTGLASSNKESISVSGKAMLEFKDRSRNTSEPSKTVDVYKKILTDCSNSVNGVTGDKALSFTLFNEENRGTKLNGNIKYNFDVTDHGEHTRNYAFDKSGVKSSSTCIYPSWADYSVTGPVQYSSDPSQNSVSKTFKDRQYNLYNQSLNNNTDQVDLYLLSDDFATPVYFEVTNQAGEPVSGATVTVNRYFIGENSYLTVAKSEADSDGVATTYMRVNEIYYKYTVTKNGEVLLDTDRQILTCQTTPCTKELRVNPEEDNPYFLNKKGFEYNTSNITNDDGNLTGFQATVSHDSDVMKQASLEVVRGQGVSKETVCDIKATSNPATLVCSFDKPAGDDFISYTLQASTNGENYLLDKDVLNQPPNVFGDQAYFPAVMIFLMFSMMGLISPKLGITFSTAGVIVPWALGFYSLSLAAVGSLVAVGIILMVTNNS